MATSHVAVEPSSAVGLTFTAPRLEEVFLVYAAEKNRGLTLRLHFMLTAAWAIGALKTTLQCSQAWSLGEARVVPKFLFLLAAQLLNFGYQVLAMQRLRSLDRKQQLQQEQVKAWLAVASDLTVMVCVLLSDPTLPHAPAPLPSLVVTAFLGVLDTIRLESLLRLHVVKWLCFLIVEADFCLRAPGHWPREAGRDVLHGVLLGTLLPFCFAAVSEASQRAAFLRDCKRPLADLGPFWGWVHAVVQLFARQPEEEPDDSHED